MLAQYPPLCPSLGMFPMTHKRPLFPVRPSTPIMHIQVMLMSDAAMEMCDEWRFHAALDLALGRAISCSLSHSPLKAWHWYPPSAPQRRDKSHTEPFNFPLLPLKTTDSIETESAGMWD